jgi:sugar phosphate isomerase/epimerase
MSNRREFLKKGMVGIVAGSALSLTKAHAKGSTKKKDDSFQLGIAGYSFVHFDLEQSLEMMEKVNVHYLCIKDFHLPYDSTQEQIAAFHERLKASGVTGYAVGPIYVKTRDDIDNAFDYARRVGVDMVVGIPTHEDLEYLDTKVKEYDIRFAIHNHGPEDELYPNATSIIELIKDLDPRIGLCFDIGHNMRDGEDPIADLKRYADRIFDMHLKNVTAAEAEGKTCELGRGVIDIPAYVKMMREVNYSYVCSLEYEKDMKDPLAGIAESIGYFNGVSDATQSES